MSVTLQIKLNGGAAETGGVQGALGDVVQLTASSKVGWATNSARFEISDFPVGFALPAGWSLDATTGAYYYATNNQDPPPFTVPSALWGKWMTTLGATDASGESTDRTTALSVLSPSGLEDLGRGEGSVFGGTQKRWTAGWQNNLRIIESALAGPGVSVVPEDDDATGATMFDRAVAIWASGRDVELISGGTYKTSARLDPPPGRRILSKGRSVLMKGSSFASGSVDDRANSVIHIAGAATGSVSTTLSATAPMGSLTLSVASGTGIVADMWLKLEGDNVADLFGGQSDAEVVVELVQVESIVGTTVTLKTRTCMHHAIGKPIVSYAPWVGDPLKPAVDGIFFDWTGAGTTAVAVEVTNAVNVFLDRVEGRNFTRNVIDIKGSKNVRIDEPISRGDNNGLVHFYTSHLVDVDRPRATGECGRVNAAGIPRPLLLCDDHPVGVSVRDVKMRKIAGMWRTWGGIMCGVDGFDVQDADGAEIVARDTYLLASNETGWYGVIWDGGPSHLPYATFHFFTYLRNGQAQGVTHPSAVNQCAIYAHDGPMASLANITIGNKGGSPGTAGSYLNGLFISDTDGEMTNISIYGARIGLMTRNFFNRWHIDNLRINGSPGEGAQGVIGLWFDAQGGINTSPIFGTMVVQNVASYFYFGTEWLANPDHSLSIQHAHFDGFIGEKVYALNYATGPVGGSVLRVTGSSPEAIQEATGPSARNVIAMGSSINGWGFAAFGDAVAKHTGTAATRGDLLEADATGNLVVNNSPASAFTARYRAVVASASGYVNVQKVA